MIAHNLNCWAPILANHQPINHRTLRTRIITIPAVVVNRSGRHTLRLPTHWPWADTFTSLLTAMRARPGPAG